MIKRVRHSLAVALVLLTIYEFCLSTMGIREFILYAPREGLVAANREGLCSCVGYISINLFAMSFGRMQYKDLYIMDKEEESGDNK